MRRRSIVITFLVIWAICVAITFSGASSVPDDGSFAERAGFWTGSRLGFPAALAAIATLIIVGIASLVARIRRQ